MNEPVPFTRRHLLSVAPATFAGLALAACAKKEPDACTSTLGLTQEEIKTRTSLGYLPFFRGPKVGVGLLCASLVLAVMILPTIASISREVLRAVPSELREGGLALGATRWDVVRRIVLPHAKSGIFGAVLLGFGRAVGETMAVAMVVGSRPEISPSLFAPGYTMASVLANEFAEATSALHVAALAEIGLLLFAVTLAFNVAARVFVSRMRKPLVEEATS
jgi:phosphate transport system permease protein